MHRGYTNPGYVYYQKPGWVGEITKANVETTVAADFGSASWSFDGPSQEFRTIKVNNANQKVRENYDCPGTECSDRPYAMKTEFLIVLYDENAKLVFEVGHQAATIELYKDSPIPIFLAA
jgi:hypothetical protein